MHLRKVLYFVVWRTILHFYLPWFHYRESINLKYPQYAREVSLALPELISMVKRILMCTVIFAELNYTTAYKEGSSRE